MFRITRSDVTIIETICARSELIEHDINKAFVVAVEAIEGSIQSKIKNLWLEQEFFFLEKNIFLRKNIFLGKKPSYLK